LASISLVVGDFSAPSYLPLIYPVMVLYLLFVKQSAESVYWFYPYINTGLGGLLFLLGALQTPF